MDRRRLALAILAAWLLIIAEFAVVAIANRARIANVWELMHGSLWLAPAALSAAGLLGVLGAVGVELLIRSRLPSFRVLLSALVFVSAAIGGWGVGGGRHLASVGARSAFALLLGATLAGVGWLLAKPARRLIARRPVLSMALTLGLIAGIEFANHRVLVRLYPAFHGSLAVAALLLAPLLAAPWFRVPMNPQRPQPRWWLLVPASLLALAALVPTGARRLALFDNFRLVLLDGAPLLGRAVELAAVVAPPQAPDDAVCDTGDCTGLTPAGSAERAIDFRGRDLLLISIDALRADHVGAYGYARPTTPAIDTLARTGAVFEHAYAATPHTSYSVTSLMTGKYMRPLLLQGAGADSDTLAGLLRTYGYRTAAFYPPAVFFIDQSRFESFEKTALGFEYRWVEFAEGAQRVSQVSDYLQKSPREQRLFVWVHLFGPHEPYEMHAEHPFGDRDLDRYDSEIAAADDTAGQIVRLFRERSPKGVVIVTADHGEEFGEHGGRYHGTSVYEEQVRVPLVISAPGAVSSVRIGAPVQTVDILPTLLSALDVPRPPRVRGRDLGTLVTGKEKSDPGMAYAETDEQSLFAEGSLRLVCARRVGACQLFDVAQDSAENNDLSRDRPRDAQRLRERLHGIAASQGRFEASGLRAEGKGWPSAILRAIAGDGDAAEDLTALLDDADLGIRRKAAELLFELRRPESAPALRLAIGREEDETAKRWAALALTRLGQGAPLTNELVNSSDLQMRRFAALALAENGDRRGEAELVAWWQDESARDFDRSKQLLEALGGLRSKSALGPLLVSLDDVRLRPFVAKALGRIGEKAARGALVQALRDERLQSSRRALIQASVDLGGKEELAAPLTRFLGVPDPVPDGVGQAARAGILQYVGGPKGSELTRLREQSELGVVVPLVVPSGGNGKGVRIVLRARSRTQGPAVVLVGSADHLSRYAPDGKLKKSAGLPSIDPEHSVRITVPASESLVEIAVTLPQSFGMRPGLSTRLIVYGGRDAQIDALVAVPLADEVPPPAPKPWRPEEIEPRPGP